MGFFKRNNPYLNGSNGDSNPYLDTANPTYSSSSKSRERYHLVGFASGSPHFEIVTDKEPHPIKGATLVGLG